MRLLNQAALSLHRWLRWPFEEVRNDLPAYRIVSDDLPEGHKRVCVPVQTLSGFGQVLVQGHAGAFDQFFEDQRELHRRAGERLDASLRSPQRVAMTSDTRRVMGEDRR